MFLKVISSNNIDRLKYDRCIAADPEATVFNEAWYMDLTADSWKVLTNDDYTTVFPFSVRSKFGLSYIYQPFFNRNTGIYGKDKEIFLKQIDERLLQEYLLSDFCCDASVKKTAASYYEKQHQQLILHSNYLYIYSQYSVKLKRNLRLAENDKVTVREVKTTGDFTKQFRKHTGNKIREFKNRDYETLQSLTDACLQREGGLLIEAYQHDVKTAAALFIRSNNRILYIEGYSSPLGRSLRSMHVLFDYVIHKYADTGYVFDFGGSNLKSVARFFKSFGAVDRVYYRLYKNRLPLLFRWLKKSG